MCSIDVSQARIDVLEEARHPRFDAWNSQHSPLSRAFGSKAWALRSTTVGQRAEESIARVEEEAGVTAMTARSSLALAIFKHHVNIM